MERATRILAEVDDALEHVKKAGRGESGRLLIGFAGSTVFHPRVAATLRRFQQKYPAVHVTTEESNSTALLKKMADAQVDCAFVRLPLDCGDLTTVSFADEAMFAVLPTGHRLGKLQSVDLAQLASDPFVLFPRSIGPDLHDSITSSCRSLGFSPRIQEESPQISSTINMVAAGFGVTVVPDSLLQIQTDGVTYQKIRNKNLRTTIALVVRPREKSIAVRNFVNTLRTAAQQKT